MKLSYESLQNVVDQLISVIVVAQLPMDSTTNKLSFVLYLKIDIPFKPIMPRAFRHLQRFKGQFLTSIQNHKSETPKIWAKIRPIRFCQTIDCLAKFYDCLAKYYNCLAKFYNCLAKFYYILLKFCQTINFNIILPDKLSIKGPIRYSLYGIGYTVQAIPVANRVFS